MRILFAGIIARYPFGGVTWCSLMYLLGLRALGHEVFYLEDTGECVYDPIQNTRATDPGYGTTYIHNALEPDGLGDRRSFVNYGGSYHARAAQSIHDRDDVADRKLHRRRGQQGSGVREVHRSAVEDPAAVRARDQRPATAVAAARLGDGRRDARVAHAERVSRFHPRIE